jgi:hypothetical protein
MRNGALLILAATTDTEARRDSDGWLTRCLHCGSQVGVLDTGRPTGTTTVEHIVPRTSMKRVLAACITVLLSSEVAFPATAAAQVRR